MWVGDPPNKKNKCFMSKLHDIFRLVSSNIFIVQYLYIQIAIFMNSLAMNPMELYVDQPEGVALYSAAAGGKFFACYLFSHFR